MLTDALTTLVNTSAPLSLVAGAGINIASPVFDIAGVGVGVQPPNIIGNVTTFGSDMGIGGFKAEMEILLGTALATSNSATLTIALQLAADDGTYNPSTWYDGWQSAPITAAQGTANTVVARLPWPPAFPANLRPRFMRLYFQVPAGENFTAGTILFAGVVLVRDDQANAYAAKNFTVS